MRLAVALEFFRASSKLEVIGQMPRRHAVEESHTSLGMAGYLLRQLSCPPACTIHPPRSEQDGKGLSRQARPGANISTMRCNKGRQRYGGGLFNFWEEGGQIVDLYMQPHLRYLRLTLCVPSPLPC